MLFINIKLIMILLLLVVVVEVNGMQQNQKVLAKVLRKPNMFVMITKYLSKKEIFYIVTMNRDHYAQVPFLFVDYGYSEQQLELESKFLQNEITCFYDRYFCPVVPIDSYNQNLSSVQYLASLTNEDNGYVQLIWRPSSFISTPSIHSIISNQAFISYSFEMATKTLRICGPIALPLEEYILNVNCPSAIMYEKSVYVFEKFYIRSNRPNIPMDVKLVLANNGSSGIERYFLPDSINIRYVLVNAHEHPQYLYGFINIKNKKVVKVLYKLDQNNYCVILNKESGDNESFIFDTLENATQYFNERPLLQVQFYEKECHTDTEEYKINNDKTFVPIYGIWLKPPLDQIHSPFDLPKVKVHFFLIRKKCTFFTICKK